MIIVYNHKSKQASHAPNGQVQWPALARPTHIFELKIEIFIINSNFNRTGQRLADTPKKKKKTLIPTLISLTQPPFMNSMRLPIIAPRPTHTLIKSPEFKVDALLFCTNSSITVWCHRPSYCKLVIEKGRHHLEERLSFSNNNIINVSSTGKRLL